VIINLPTKRIEVTVEERTFLRVLPTRWRRKPAGIDTERNYVTVTLCKPPKVSPPVGDPGPHLILVLQGSEWVSSFLTSHQHSIGYSVPWSKPTRRHNPNGIPIGSAILAQLLVMTNRTWNIGNNRSQPILLMRPNNACRAVFLLQIYSNKGLPMQCISWKCTPLAAYNKYTGWVKKVSCWF